MALEYETKSIAQLDDLINLSMATLMECCNADGISGKINFNKLSVFLAPYVSVIGGAAYIAVTGNTLPTPPGAGPYFTITPRGVYSGIVAGGLLNIWSYVNGVWSVNQVINIDLGSIVEDYGLKKVFTGLPYSNQIFNGANRGSSTDNIIGIPTGQTGNSSLIGMDLSSQSLFKNIWFKTLGQNIVLELLSELVNIDPANITADISGLVGGTIVSVKTTLISGNIYKTEVVFSTTVKPVTIYPFIQKIGPAVPATATMKLLDVAFYLKPSNNTTINNINTLTLPKLLQEQSQNVTKINVGKSQTPGGVVFDYVGNNAIQVAINSVQSMATINNQYEIIIHEGVYEALQVSDFTANGGFTFIYIPPFIKLRGVSKDKVIIRGFLPNNLGSSFDYSSYQTIYSHGDVSGITNCTITSQNILYAIHIDYFTHGLAYYTQSHKNLKIVNYGNDGNATGKGGYQALGFGTSEGLNIEFIDDEFICQGAPLQLHTNANFEKEATVKYSGCKFIKTANNVLPQVADVSSLGSRRNDRIDIEGCSFNGGYRFNISDANNQNTNIDTSDYNAFTPKIYGFGNSSFLLTQSFTGGQALRVRSNNLGGRVEFDLTSSAFPVLVRDQYFNGGQYVNDLGEIQESGYTYRGSISGYKGYAIGKLDLSGYQIPTGTMGQRLGNCTTTNKVLTIIINYTNYTVVFNKNYSNYTNQQVLDEINSVIRSFATADLYSIANDYYPEFTDVMGKGLASENLLNGNIIAIENGKIRKATSSDKNIVGVAIDDIPSGVIGRFLKKGIIDVDYSKRFYALIDTNVVVNKGDRFSVSSANSGTLVVNTTFDYYFTAIESYILKFDFTK